MSLAAIIAKAIEISKQPSSLAGFGIMYAGVHSMIAGDYTTGAGMLMTGMGAVLVPENAHLATHTSGKATTRHKPKQVKQPAHHREEEYEYDYEYAEAPRTMPHQVQEEAEVVVHEHTRRKPPHKKTATERFAGAIKESLTPKLQAPDGCFSAS
jgi:hypothetical protein